MTRSQYASSITPPPPTLTLTAGNISADLAGTYSFWLYIRNRAGVTLFSDRSEITIAENQGIQVTIPATVITSGGYIYAIGIVANLDDTNPVTGCVLATYPGDETLPADVFLFENEHLTFFGTVADTDSLPTGSDRLHGMRRYIDSIGLIQAYNAFSLPTNKWESVYPQDFNPYLNDTLVEGGADVDLSLITDPNIIITPDYEGDGNPSEEIDFWIVNDTSVPIAQGTRVRLAVTLHNQSIAADDFVGLIEVRHNGYVDTSTGELDTNGLNVGSYLPYDGLELQSFLLEKDLPVNSAYSLTVRANFANFALNNTVLQGALLKFYPYFGPFRAIFDSSGEFIGDHIKNTLDRRRLVPNGPGLSLIALTGTGVVKNYRFTSAPIQEVPGLALNTANQKVVITNNGTCYVASSVPDTAALRAVVGTEDLVGKPYSLGSLAPSSSQLVEIDLVNPTKIRGDYPDGIANVDAILNSNVVRIYADDGNTVTYWEVNISGENEVFTVGATTGTSSSLPSPADKEGLFAPDAIASVTTGSSIFDGSSLAIYIAYVYQNTVTSISHSINDGCLDDSVIPYAEASRMFQEAGNYWGKRVPSNDALADLTVANDNLGEYKTYIGAGERLYYYDPNEVRDDGLLYKAMNSEAGAMVCRELPLPLLEDFTLYVSADGLANNSGLDSNNPLSWSEMRSRVNKLDLNGKTLTIKSKSEVAYDSELSFPNPQDSTQEGTFVFTKVSGSSVQFNKKVEIIDIQVKLAIFYFLTLATATDGLVIRNSHNVHITYFDAFISQALYADRYIGNHNNLAIYRSTVSLYGNAGLNGDTKNFIYLDELSLVYTDISGYISAPIFIGSYSVSDAVLNVNGGSKYYLGANAISLGSTFAGVKYKINGAQSFIQCDGDLEAAFTGGNPSPGIITTKLAVTDQTLQGQITKSVTTSAIADGAAQSDLNIELAQEFLILKVVTDVAARVRGYSTNAAREADLNRTEETAPTGQEGLIFDIVTESPSFSWKLNPQAFGYNEDDPKTKVLYLTVTNKSGTSNTVTATITTFVFNHF